MPSWAAWVGVIALTSVHAAKGDFSLLVGAWTPLMTMSIELLPAPLGADSQLAPRARVHV